MDRPSPKPAPHAEMSSPASDAAARSAALQSLDAQAALLPYVLIFFGVALPVFAWATSFAVDRLWASASFVIFAVNWAALYAFLDWMKRHPERRLDVNFRTRVHVLGGLMWAGALAQITAIGLGAGPARESILLMAAGAAATTVFFCAPNMAVLLIVSPVACAPPILGLYAEASSRPAGRITMAAIALSMALSLIFNRLLRRLFALSVERERLIDERMASLVEAEAVTKSRSNLIATLSHEIRNGLTSLTHLLAATRMGGRTAPTREQLSAALGSTEELIGVLNATLDTVTAETDGLVVERRPFDPAKLARAVFAAHRAQAAAKGLELSIHVDESLTAEPPGAAIGDTARARQILNNLVGNAIRYTVRGRVELRVEPLAPGRVRLEVADTGPGLTPTELEDAFQPFKRVKRTGAGAPGAGLGLSLSRRLALLMGGAISAESAVGVGSCFRLDLPFDPAVRGEPAGAPDGKSAGGGRASAALRVLIVEEQPLNAAVMRTAVEQLGHQVLHAQDAGRARDLAGAGDIDLILLESRLPDVDGAAIIASMREIKGAKAPTPIIAVIGGDPDEARACLDAGADEVLRKPVTVASVARAMAGAMNEDYPQLRSI